MSSPNEVLEVIGQIIYKYPHAKLGKGHVMHWHERLENYSKQEILKAFEDYRAKNNRNAPDVDDLVILLSRNNSFQTNSYSVEQSKYDFHEVKAFRAKIKEGYMPVVSKHPRGIAWSFYPKNDAIKFGNIISMVLVQTLTEVVVLEH